MTKPVRLQLSRAKGFNLQALSRATNGLEAVNVARPSKFGNPFLVGSRVYGMEDGRCTDHDMTREEAVWHYRLLVSRIDTPEDRAHWDEHFDGLSPDLTDIVRELRGKNLACWCSGSPCHADVLLELANA